jgi:hypothetical protein
MGASSAFMIFSATTVSSPPPVGRRTANSSPPQARDHVGIAQRPAHPQPHFAQRLVADGVAERVVDGLEAIHVEKQHADLVAVAPRGAHRLLELVDEHRAVRKRGEAVLVGEAQDLALAAHDAVEHVVEAHRELADLVLLPQVHVARVVAVLDAARRLGQARDRARDAARDQQAAGHQQQQARQREPEERGADAAEGGEAHGEGLLQQRRDARLAERVDGGHARLVLLASQLDLAETGAARRGVHGRRERLAQRRVERRGADAPAARGRAREERDFQPGELVQLLRHRVVHLEAQAHVGDRFRRHHRHHHQLVQPLAQGDDGRRLAGGGARRDQRRIGERLAGAGRVARVGDHQAIERHQRHHVGAEARAVVAEHRDDGAGVVGGDRLAEAVVGGQDRRALLEPRLVLREQLAEDALALAELLLDGLARDLRVGAHHQQRAHALHQHQQRHEEHDDARAEPREAGKLSRRRGGHQYRRRSRGGLYFALRGCSTKSTTARRLALAASVSACAATAARCCGCQARSS